MKSEEGETGLKSHYPPAAQYFRPMCPPLYLRRRNPEKASVYPRGRRYRDVGFARRGIPRRRLAWWCCQKRHVARGQYLVSPINPKPNDVDARLLHLLRSWAFLLAVFRTSLGFKGSVCCGPLEGN